MRWHSMRALVCLLSVFAFGCGSLNARVSIFDQKGYDDYKYVKQSLPRLIALRDSIAHPSTSQAGGKEQRVRGQRNAEESKEVKERLSRIDSTIDDMENFISFTEREGFLPNTRALF